MANLPSPTYFGTNFLTPTCFRASLSSPTYLEANLPFPTCFGAKHPSPTCFGANLPSSTCFRVDFPSPNLLRPTSFFQPFFYESPTFHFPAPLFVLTHGCNGSPSCLRINTLPFRWLCHFPMTGETSCSAYSGTFWSLIYGPPRGRRLQISINKELIICITVGKNSC